MVYIWSLKLRGCAFKRCFGFDIFSYGTLPLSSCYCTVLPLIHSKVLTQLKNAPDFGHMSGFHSRQVTTLSDWGNKCVYVCVTYSPG